MSLNPLVPSIPACAFHSEKSMLIKWALRLDKGCITFKSAKLRDREKKTSQPVSDRCVLFNFYIWGATQTHQRCTLSAQVKVSFESSTFARSMNSEFITVLPVCFELCWMLSVLCATFSTNVSLCNKVSCSLKSSVVHRFCKHYVLFL